MKQLKKWLVDEYVLWVISRLCRICNRLRRLLRDLERIYIRWITIAAKRGLSNRVNS